MFSNEDYWYGICNGPWIEYFLQMISFRSEPYIYLFVILGKYSRNVTGKFKAAFSVMVPHVMSFLSYYTPPMTMLVIQCTLIQIHTLGSWTRSVGSEQNMSWSWIWKRKKLEKTFDAEKKRLLRGERGGVFQKIWKFLCLNLVALLMGDQELFTESKNLQQLPSYGPPKLGGTQGFSSIHIGKSKFLVIKNDLLFLSTFGG